MSEPISTAPPISHAEQLLIAAAPVLQTVATLPQSTAGKPAYKTASFWGGLLGALNQAAPAVLQATRANPKQTSQVQFGLLAATMILAMFSHPAAEAN